MHATHGRGTEEGGEGRWNERTVGRFDMELHIIKPAPVFMVESHPPYLFVYPFLIPASSLAPSSLYSRHRAIKFGNSIPPAAFTHVHTYVSYPYPGCGSVDVSSARLKSTAFYKRIKVNGGGAPSAIPRKAHPSGFPSFPPPHADLFPSLVMYAAAGFSYQPRRECRCQDRIFVYNPRRISVLYFERRGI